MVIREEAGLDTKPKRKPPRTVVDVRKKQPDTRRFYSTPGLRDARLARELSQEELAKRSGISRLTIHSLEWGDRRCRPGTAKKLLAGLSTVSKAEPAEIIQPEKWKKRRNRGDGEEMDDTT